MSSPVFLALMCPNRCRQSSMYRYKNIKNKRNSIMTTKMMHLPSGAVYNNRKEAKLMMGHANYNRALKNRLIMFINDSCLLENKH